MPSPSFEQLLDRAASEWGIEPDFWDIWGRHHVTPASAKQAILRAMGVDADTTESLEAALAARTRREWQRVLPPVVLAGESTEIELSLRIPAESMGETAHIKVLRENGAVFEFEQSAWEFARVGGVEMDGRTWLEVQTRLPVQLPLGYHEVSVRVAGATATTRYIVTPERAWAHPTLGRGGRAAGVAISLYGVRSARNWGCGDFRDLLDVIDWVADELKAGFVALNPLHAIHNRRPFNTSPYLPNSIFYQNFLYLDVEGIDQFSRCRRAQELRRSAEVETEIQALRGARFVEYERVSALKLRFLKLLFVQFLRERRQEVLQEFLEREGELVRQFATYCALDEHLHRRNPDLWIWPDWPEAYRDPCSAETRAFAEKHRRSVMFYCWLQWQIDIQLERAQQHARNRHMPIGLYHDLALATDRFGSDLWAHRRFFVAGCRVGSPPDDFAPQGQDWAFPPPNSEQHRENGYRLFAETICRNCRHGGALRIDHVMRLFRLYWIPDGCDATQGAYVHERTDDFLRILALESVRNQVVIVGEDLGTVDPAIRETLAKFGILSYRLLYFEKDGHGAFRKPEEYPRHALVSSTTHDLPTLAGFWIGADIAARRDVGILDAAGYDAQMRERAAEKQKLLEMLFDHGLMNGGLPRSAAAYPELTGELHNAVVGFLANTPSELLAINQEDLTKETAQQNLPGTTWQYPNWGRKMRFSLEDLRGDQQAQAYTAMLRNWIIRSGRQNFGA